MWHNVKTALSQPRLGAGWLWWATSRRLLGPPTVRLPNGAEFGGFGTFSEYWSFCGPSDAEYRLIERAVPPAGVVLDVGANAGSFAVTIGRTRPGATVHAFEPVPRTFDILKANLARNGVANVRAHNSAVGNTAGAVVMTGAVTGSAVNYVLVGGGQGVTVPCAVLDQFLADHGIDTVDFLKIDVEGYEPKVLQGLSGTLAAGRVRRLLIEVIPALLRRQGASVEAVVAALHPHGYRLFALAPDGDRGAEAVTADDFERGGWNYLVERP